MKPVNKTVLVLGIIALSALLGAFIYIGYTIYPKLNPLPETKTDTVLLHDSIWITFNNDQPYSLKPDSIIHIDSIPSFVDTAAILKDYFAEVYYNKQFRDSNIVISDSIMITMNRLKANHIRYKWLKPIQIVTNVTNNNTFYTSYLSFGLDVPFYDPKLTEIASLLTMKKGSIGIGFVPYNQQFNLKCYITAYHFRGRGGSK